MQQAQKGKTSNRLQKYLHRIKIKVHVHAKHDPNNAHITEILDTLKQKLSETSQRLRRYKEANKRKQQNRLFATNEKTFYHNLKSVRRPDCQDTLLDTRALTAFWASIWGNAVKHNLKASWIRREQTRVSTVTSMEHSPITTEQVSRLIAKTLNWKAPGPEGIHNF
jgi:arsenate reductase-like glutaredoxin family protein